MKFLVIKISQWKWAKDNPKRFFKVAIVFLAFSLIATIILETWVLEKPKTSPLFPSLYNKSEKVIQRQEQKDGQLKGIFEELKIFEYKRERGLLTSDDLSLIHI